MNCIDKTKKNLHLLSINIFKNWPLHNKKEHKWLTTIQQRLSELYGSVFVYHILQHSEGKIMLFSFSIIYHAYALLVPKVNTYFCIFCKNSPILIPGVILLNPSGRFLNPGVKMGKLHFAHILHCTTIHSGIILFLTNSFFVWMLNNFFGYFFFCFQYACFFDYFLLFKNFFSSFMYLKEKYES